MTTIQFLSQFFLFCINKLLTLHSSLSVQFQMKMSDESIQLIATNQHNQFYLTPKAKSLLNTLNKPLSLVSIAGMYRTGKSYLVNRLLRNKQSGFKTGSTTQSVTKGLNIWGRPIIAQDQHGEEMMYLVIDSEGIGSCEQESKYDTKLLMLLFLISSTVVYNSMGAIDQNTLDQLRVVLNLQQCLSPQTEVQKPKLVWVLRDFALQLIDKNGHEMSPDEYLEQCLKEAPAASIEIQKKNLIRQGIKQRVGKRRCFTLVRPTISEEDLADLSKCKIRNEFLNEIEMIREEVFGENSEDIKRIGGRVLTGKMLVLLIEECLSLMNSDEIPQMGSVWQTVRDIADQESYDELCDQMKQQLQKVALPMELEQLKSRLNKTQNKFYAKLSNLYGEVDSFKKYNRQFLGFTLKLNKEMKTRNAALNKEKTMKELKLFIRENMAIETVQPWNLSGVKVLIDRMELRVKKESQGYEYVLGVLCDLMRVCQQKTQRLQTEYTQMERLLQMGSLQRKNADINLITTKQEYNQSLKTICNLKATLQESEKQLALLQHQNQMLQMSVKGQEQESEGRHASLIRQMEETSFKAKQRNEEMNRIIRQLRKQKLELESELHDMKQARLVEGLNERKEVIFEEKMRQTWDKFEEERNYLRGEINKLRKQAEQYRNSWEEERRVNHKLQEESKQQLAKYSQREKEYNQKIVEIKKLHAQTKQTYMLRVDASQGTDRLFKNIENLKHSNVKSNQKAMNLHAQQRDSIRKHYQYQIDKLNRVHREEADSLSSQVVRLKTAVNDQQSQLQLKQDSLRRCLEQKERLQDQLMSATERFNDTVSQIQHAKEKERSMYEESIVRLLNNLDHRQYLKKR